MYKRRKPVVVLLAVLALGAFACQLVSQPASQRNSQPDEPPADQPGSGELSGEQVFQQTGCDQCHNPVLAVAAPSLEGVYGSQVELESGETVTADEAYLRESILSPGAKIVRGYQPIMPDFSSQLSDEEVTALVGYIRSLGD